MSRSLAHVAAVCLVVLLSPLAVKAGEETGVLIRGGTIVHVLSAAEAILGPAVDSQKHPSKQMNITVHRFRFSEEEDLLVYEWGSTLLQVARVPLDSAEVPPPVQNRNFSQLPRSYVLSRRGRHVSLVVAYVSKDLSKRNWVRAWVAPKPQKAPKDRVEPKQPQESRDPREPQAK